MTATTRKISKRDASAPLKRWHILTNLDIRYEQLLQPSEVWEMEQAVHLLVNEDPDDPHWMIDSGYKLSQDFKDMHKAILQAHINKRIGLQPLTLGEKTVLMAENIVFIRWALNNRFTNIPELFKEFARKSQLVDDPKMLVADDNKKTSKKRSHALHKIIIKIHQSVSNKSPEAIWKELANDDHSITIQEISSWDDPNGAIQWISPGGKERPMQKRTFENLISKINQNPSEYYHR